MSDPGFARIALNAAELAAHEGTMSLAWKPRSRRFAELLLVNENNGRELRAPCRSRVC